MWNRLGFGVLIVFCYLIYMCFYPNPQDGVLLSGVIGVLAAGGGYNLAKRRITEHYEAIASPEPLPFNPPDN